MIFILIHFSGGNQLEVKTNSFAEHLPYTAILSFFVSFSL